MQLPVAFPDEILFSRIIRHFNLSGRLPTDYLETHFKSRKASIHPFLTGDVKNICSGSQDDPKYILKSQTLAGLFCFFLPKYSKEICMALLSGNTAKAIRYCQIPSFSCKEKAHLKYCPACVSIDIKQYGIPYWHKVHQIPGILVCGEHRCKLLSVPLPERQRLNGDLLPAITSSEPELALINECKLAVFVGDLLKNIHDSKKKFHPKMFENELINRGYLTKSGHVRRKKLMRDFIDFCDSLYSRENMLPRSCYDYRYLSSILSDVSPQHPFKYILLGFWLFEDALCMMRHLSMRAYSNKSREKLDLRGFGGASSGERRPLVGVSWTTGKSRCYPKYYSRLDNVVIDEDPSLMLNSVRYTIYNMAIKGFHRKAIARRCEVSVGYVEQEISSYKGLVAYRKKCRYESRRRRCRARLYRYMKDNPHVVQKDIKRDCSSSFFWLYNNDRVWLEENLPKARCPNRVSRVDWDQRDKEISNYLIAFLEKECERWTRTSLDKKLGGHRWLTRFITKLPLTEKVLLRFGV